MNRRAPIDQTFAQVVRETRAEVQGSQVDLAVVKSVPDASQLYIHYDIKKREVAQKDAIIAQLMAENNRLHEEVDQLRRMKVPTDEYADLEKRFKAQCAQLEDLAERIEINKDIVEYSAMQQSYIAQQKESQVLFASTRAIETKEQECAKLEQKLEESVARVRALEKENALLQIHAQENEQLKAEQRDLERMLQFMIDENERLQQ